MLTYEQQHENPLLYRHYSCSALNLFGYDDDCLEQYQRRDATLPLIPEDLAFRGRTVTKYCGDMQKRERILKEIRLMQENPTHVAPPGIVQVSFLYEYVDLLRELTVEDLYAAWGAAHHVQDLILTLTLTLIGRPRPGRGVRWEDLPPPRGSGH